MHCTLRVGHGHNQPWGFGSHYDCQCHGQGYHHPPRRFPTKKEVITELEEYLTHIQQEAEAVEKQIKELKERK